jgi:serine/threonine protein kinase/Tol biopolymer transport system component
MENEESRRCDFAASRHPIVQCGAFFMPISPGLQFDHYEILAPLGKGGMGEVFRARDTRLNREVALKILPAEFVQDADRLHRFEQEAMATSSLNHPNILTVYDFGTGSTENGGHPFLVMELLEGEELRAQLEAGALAPRKAIDYAQQIAAGLAAAHEKGIVHRDLKPENLFVTKDNRVKILDFGLAKLRPPRNVSAGSDVATAKQYTSPGTVMGTVAYMSPEQVRGQDLDHRSDIFSFGIILYEMLNGQRAFTGESQVEVMHAILKADPPELSETNSKVSPQLDKIVRRCLEKKPEMRFHSAHDLGFALSTLTVPSGSRVETATALPALTESLPVGKARLFSNARLAWLAAAIAVLAALSFALAWWQRVPVEVRAVHSHILPPENLSGNGDMAISPDGRQLVMSAATTVGKPSLWVRTLDALSWRPLTGTEGAYLPFWSPDSRFIGFFAEGKLKKIAVAGGPPFTLCDAPFGRGGTWNRDGVIVFCPTGIAGPLHRIADSGGASSVVTKLDAPTGTHRHPAFLPDGQHFLYHGDGLRVASLTAPEGKLLLSGVSTALYAEGQLLFVREGTLFAQPFDARRLELTGDALPIAERVRVMTGDNLAKFSVSAQGLLVYQMGAADSGFQLTWFDRSGKQTGVLGEPARYLSLQLSPDGKSAAVQISERRASADQTMEDLWLYDIARNLKTRFTTDGKGNREAVWSPDGKRLIFNANRKGGGYDLYERNADGSGEVLVVESNQTKNPNSWSPDGRFLLYQAPDPKTQLDLWVLPLTGDRQPFPFLQTEFREERGQFSPDGRWIVYTSTESRGAEVYVAAFPGPGGKQRVSTAGGVFPRWRRDGKEIFFLAGNKLVAVAVNLRGTELEIGAAQALFDINPGSMRTGYPWDVTPDGQRFLIVTTSERKEATPITLVQNWALGVKK